VQIHERLEVFAPDIGEQGRADDARVMYYGGYRILLRNFRGRLASRVSIG
jgi:hypothetical protein